MKKSRILSLALTLALVFTTVFAGTESIFAESSNAKLQALGSTVTALEDATGSAGSYDNPIVAKNINTTGDAEIYRISYSSSASNEAAVKIPKAGVFLFNIQVNDYTTVYLYDSPDPSADPVASQNLTSTNQTVYFTAKKAGVYYLAFTTSNASAIESTFNAYYVPASDATLNAVSKTDKPFHFASSLSSTKYYRYKVKTTKTGYLTIDFSYLDESSTYTVRISNSKKKVISSATKVNYNKKFVTYAGLTKGTYYVEVKTADPIYGIRINAKYPTENSGSTKSKAKSILKGNTKNGIITATQSSSSGDWYKIKLNGNQPTTISVDTWAGSTGGIRVEFYRSSASKPFASYDFPGRDGGDITLSTTINGFKQSWLAKGTYYIKVKKYGNGNGYYKLQWK